MDDWLLHKDIVEQLPNYYQGSDNTLLTLFGRIESVIERDFYILLPLKRKFLASCLEQDEFNTEINKSDMTNEVLNISPHGFWLFVAGKEYFLGFDDFPWFHDAPVNRLFNVEFSNGRHLYWPDLDVDVDLERIEHPEIFPLVARG